MYLRCHVNFYGMPARNLDANFNGSQAAAGAELITIHISLFCNFMMITVISH